MKLFLILTGTVIAIYIIYRIAKHIYYKKTNHYEIKTYRFWSKKRKEGD